MLGMGQRIDASPSPTEAVDISSSVSRPISSSLVWATWALFAGLTLMLIGGGLFATLIGVRSELDGFDTLQIGAISAAYYAGFLVGSRVTLAHLGSVGHIRVYAALASVLAASIVAAGLDANPRLWMGLRFVAGACFAGQYVVAESWLNELATNEIRGRLLAAYNVTTVIAYGLGQLWFTQLDPKAITGFAIAAIMISLAVAPVALSEDAAPPVLDEPEHMTLGELLRVAPTGMVTCTLVGLAHGAFLGLGAVYATREGLSLSEIGLFVSIPTLGVLLMTLPISAASDDIDRRAVGALAALTAAIAAAGLFVLEADSWQGLLCVAVIGGTTYPLYSIAGAYANDFLPPEKITAAASQLVMLYGVGAMIGPLVGSAAMRAVGTDGFVWMTVVCHIAIAGFLIVRMVQYREPLRTKRKRWSEVSIAGRIFYIPATVVGTGRRLRERQRSVPEA
jgi:MFS family permease